MYKVYSDVGGIKLIMVVQMYGGNLRVHEGKLWHKYCIDNCKYAQKIWTWRGHI